MMGCQARMQMSIHAQKWWGSRWPDGEAFQSTFPLGHLLIR